MFPGLKRFFYSSSIVLWNLLCYCQKTPVVLKSPPESQGLNYSATCQKTKMRANGIPKKWDEFQNSSHVIILSTVTDMQFHKA